MWIIYLIMAAHKPSTAAASSFLNAQKRSLLRERFFIAYISYFSPLTQYTNSAAVPSS